MSAMSLGAKIATALKERRMTQKQLADLVGTSESAMSKYIKGERMPRAEILANIATALGTTSEALLGKQEGIVTPFGEVRELCARSAPHMSNEERNELIMTILNAGRHDG